MEFNSLYVFIVACLAINLIPGPDVIYIVSNTMRGKVVDGFKAAAGLGFGYAFHTAAACLGLSAIILSSAVLFNLIKILGAVYLCYLGVKSLISMYQGKSSINLEANNELESNVLLQGFIVSVLNPKVALFFLSFLPQFINPNSEAATQNLLIYGLIFSVLATLCNIIYALAGSWAFGRQSAKRYTRALEGVSGAILIGLAGKIAIDGK
ncbi:LysE family translocator [Pseudoalteromonas umbrosa]|uniref:LysE family translocator n=1 Tax=Pseudoalteromonas umbrosa TaxID=3048489 RepID=UPI0024C4193F|nr:LysE family translocator [Pseudoalteromonas sp. B95]MDK1286243.1 LysE family translocator [Pseudoalteromonas sp. B95]